MKKPQDFSHYFLYRWRYTIGYSVIGLVLIALLLFAGIFTPAGLSPAEMKSVATTASLSFSDPVTLAVPHLPYHLLQAGIFSLFGITTFTVKLPSLIIGFLAAIGLILLLRRWFTLNVAVLTSLIAITTGQFLLIAQSGTASILYIFWPIVILLLGTQITRGASKWRFAAKLGFTVAIALSLYSPLSIYSLIAIILTISLHPHLRAIIRRLSKARLAIVMGAGLVILAPIIYLISLNPTYGMTLLGLPSEWPNLIENTVTVLKQYFLFWSPSAGTVMTPVFGLGATLILGIGLYRLIRTRETTRSYLITLWMLCLAPVIILNPTFTTVSFVPLILMLAAGLTSLIGYWYRLFPRNPYARVGGLIPIIILVGVLISTGLIRYAYGYHYTPSIAPLFSKDLTLLPRDTTHLVVVKDELPFYNAVAKYRTGLTVSTTPPSGEFMTTKRAKIQDSRRYVITGIITNGYTDNADRYYSYKERTQ